MVVKRVVPPYAQKKHIIAIDRKSTIPSRTPSIFELKVQKYEELDISNNEDLLQKEFESIAEDLEDVEIKKVEIKK